MLAAVPDGLNHLVAAPWCHDADRHLAVVGGVGGEEGSALGTKIHCHAERSPEIRLKRPRGLGGVRREFGGDAARRRLDLYPLLRAAHTSSRTLSDALVRAFLLALGLPFTRASASWSACFASILGGIGRACGSPTPTNRAGPGVASTPRS